jgi:hypothetical protein
VQLTVNTESRSGHRRASGSRDTARGVAAVTAPVRSPAAP